MKKGMKRGGLLLSAVAMLVVSVTAITVASFAWFTTSVNPKVDGFDVNVITVQSLLISVNKDNGFGESVTKDQLAAVSTNQFPTPKPADAATPYEPLTNATPKLDGANVAFEAATGNLSFTDKNGADLVQVKNGEFTGWMNFDLYLQPTFDEATYASMTVTINAADKLFTVLESAPAAQKEILKTLRMAYLVKDMTAGGAYALNVFEPNKGAEFETGLNLPVNTDVATYNTIEATEVVISSTPEVKDYQLPVVTAALNNHVYQVRVFIWIEGKDKQCVNAVAGGAFNTALQFGGKVNARAAG